MLMPIISMNKMAMNESVAATCCFQEVASPTNVYWEVLNGGWIGSGFVETKKKLVHDSWFNYQLEASKDSYLPDMKIHKYVSLGGVDYVAIVVPDPLPVAWPYGIGAGDFVGITGTYAAPEDGDLVKLSALVAGGAVAFDGCCDHKDSSCRYLKFEIAHLANRHWDSVKSHGGITDWAKPHEAKRFHS